MCLCLPSGANALLLYSKTTSVKHVAIDCRLYKSYKNKAYIDSTRTVIERRRCGKMAKRLEHSTLSLTLAQLEVGVPWHVRCCVVVVVVGAKYLCQEMHSLAWHFGGKRGATLRVHRRVHKSLPLRLRP